MGQTAEVEVTQPDTTTGASSSVDSGFELWTDYLDAETAAALDPQCVVSDLQWTTGAPYAAIACLQWTQSMDGATVH